MEKKIISTGKRKAKKGGYNGNEIWTTHRLEGAVKNKSIKPKRKKGKINIKKSM